MWNSFKYAVYRHLGILETVDQLRAGKYLDGLSYVDGSSLSIYGTVSANNSKMSLLYVSAKWQGYEQASELKNLQMFGITIL